MKYIKRFDKTSDYDTFKGGVNYVTPNVTYINEIKGFRFNPKTKPVTNLITFTIAGTEYQAEEGMTWREWALSNYFVDNDILAIRVGLDGLRSDVEYFHDIKDYNNYEIVSSGGFPYTPKIFLDDLIIKDQVYAVKHWQP